MSEGKRAEHQHHHRGKSSESILDKGQILAGLSVPAGQTVLDAGCGNGYMAKEFAEIVGTTGRVYALDPDAVAIAALQTETVGTNIEPFVGDITQQTKLPPASIDLIYLSTVVHGFAKPDMEGFLEEAKRLLKANGRLAIVEIKKEPTPFGPPLDIRFSPEELRQAVDLTPTWLIDIGQYFYMQIFNKSE
jgi:ubiquinone/menaquinone biosynthesis C-methylase UbiE